MDLINTTLRNNTVTDEGSVAYISESHDMNLIESSLVELNNVSKKGIITLKSANLNFWNSTLQNNEALPYPGLFLISSNVSIAGSTIKDQTGTSAGIGFVGIESTLVLEHTVVENV